MKRKSQFLGSFGTAFQIFKATADAVLDIGGTDEDMRRILVDENLRKDIAKRIMESRNRPSPQTSKLDAAIAQLEKSNENLERPQREREMRIETATEQLIAWAGSDEGKKAAKLLELSRNEIQAALDKVGYSHLKHHPRLDTAIANTAISNDPKHCKHHIRWWCDYRELGNPEGYLPFLKHQVNLVAELQERRTE